MWQTQSAECSETSTMAEFRVSAQEKSKRQSTPDASSVALGRLAANVSCVIVTVEHRQWPGVFKSDLTAVNMIVLEKQDQLLHLWHGSRLLAVNARACLSLRSGISVAKP